MPSTDTTRSTPLGQRGLSGLLENSVEASEGKMEEEQSPPHKSVSFPLWYCPQDGYVRPGMDSGWERGLSHGKAVPAQGPARQWARPPPSPREGVSQPGSGVPDKGDHALLGEHGGRPGEPSSWSPLPPGVRQ